MFMKTIIGLTTKATNSIHPTRSMTNRPYSYRAPIPPEEMASNTRPIIPRGAKFDDPLNHF